MNARYLFQSALIHFFILAGLFWLPLFRKTPEIIWIDGFDYGGGGGGGGKSGPKASQMGQQVPQPVKIPIPSRPAPVQRPVQGEETWRIKKDSEQIKPTPKTIPEIAEPGEKTQPAESNIIRRGVKEGTTAGDGSYDFGPGSGGGQGTGIGIGVGPGEGGGFGFGGYLRVMRQRIWSEWTQSAVFGTKLSCVVGMTIVTNGDVSDIQLEKSSGNPFYDNVALRAVRNSTPLPPLPPNFPKASQRFNIQFRLQD